jgi:gliding motility-associated-like protein
LGRKSLIVTVLLIAVTLQLSAQSGASSFEFTENRGQWDKQVRFRGEAGAGAFFLHNNGFTVVQHNGNDLNNFFHRHHEADTRINRPDRGPHAQPGQPPAPQPGVVRSHAYRVQFIGADENSMVMPDKQVQTNTSYFIGNDPSKWAVNVSVYQAIVYKNIYPNIDIRYYSEYGRLKYDLIVHPGGDVSNIAMKYEGADKLSVKNNELVIKTSVGDLKELYPYSYTFDMTNGKKEVTCNYELVDKNTVKFRIANYSKTSTLVIDPTLVWCSFTGSPAIQYGYTATPGPDGSLYSGGIVFGNGFPTTPGAYQTGYVGGDDVHDLGGIDMGIFKFTPNGRRAYATYLGGNRNDYPHSLICDGQGNLVVMGKTYSSNWPGTLKGSGGGSDIALAKLNASGTALIGALRIGGSAEDGVNISNQIESGGTQKSTVRFYGDDSRSEVILDAANNIYVAAQTQSGNFPATAGAFQTTAGGAQDGVVIKVNPACNDVLWASFLGGQGDDGAFVLALNPSNNELFVAGATTSGTNFPPANKPGVYQDSYQGGVADGYVSRISNNGSTILNTTFLGTNLFDAVYGIRFDKNAIPYVMGVTEGSWPVVNATYKVDNSKQFVAKLKPDLSGFIYSTVFGNGSARPNISPVAFLVDRCENVYISGWGGWLEPGSDPYNMGGIGNMPLTADAIKRTTDNRDFYFIVIKRDATELLYGTYFGQSGGEGEHVDGGTSRYDAQGVIYQAICANCFGSQEYPITQSFPTTPGVWAERNGSQQCNLAAVKIAFNFAGVAAGPKAFFNNLPDTVGCVPFTLQFRDTVRNAKSYEWDFDGDGVTDRTTTNIEETFTFTAVGNYRVRLIAIDPATCNQRDTAYITIRVKDDPADINFEVEKDGPCESLGFNFKNTSIPPPGKPFGPASFAWDFGDGTPIVPTNTDPVKHYYTAPGTYPVRLILLDTNYCNGGDWKQINLGVVANVEARVETPSMGCAPYNAYFNNTSLGGHDYLWDFGDGTTSTEMSPTHLYNNIGTYNITLTVTDTNTCNKTDTHTFTLTVNTKPTAAFSITPTVPEVNKPTTFLNQSIGGTEYHWFFGDGDSTRTTTMENVMYQYNATGTYTALLITFNQFGCTDTARHTVEALIDPLLDVPNAFTPGRGNRASIVKVAGFGIEKMTWRIYNRWGQKVFETTNRNTGWDGTFQGKLQPMDVYTYTLDVVFTDGRPLRKTGDITLIR